MSRLEKARRRYMAAMIRTNRAWNIDMPQDVKDRRLGEMVKAFNALMNALPVRLPGNGFTIWTRGMK